MPIYVSENSQGLSPDTLVYSIFSSDWKRVFDVELTKEQFKKLKKKAVHVSWMRVLSESDESLKTGTYAEEVPELKQLKRV